MYSEEEFIKNISKIFLNLLWFLSFSFSLLTGVEAPGLCPARRQEGGPQSREPAGDDEGGPLATQAYLVHPSQVCHARPVGGVSCCVGVFAP